MTHVPKEGDLAEPSMCAYLHRIHLKGCKENIQGKYDKEMIIGNTRVFILVKETLAFKVFCCLFEV